MFGFSQKITDPVCGMKIDKNKAKLSEEYGGIKYSFCSENCKDKFNAGAKKYITKNVKKDCCG